MRRFQRPRNEVVEDYGFISQERLPRKVFLDHPDVPQPQFLYSGPQTIHERLAMVKAFLIGEFIVLNCFT